MIAERHGAVPERCSAVKTARSERAHAEVAVVRYASYDASKMAGGVGPIALQDSQDKPSNLDGGLTLSVTAL